MLDRRLRSLKDRALGPAIRRLATTVSAGTLTAASLVMAVSAAGAAWAGWPIVAVGSWWLSRLLDGLDGPVARARGEATDLGGYLDMIVDTVGYALIPLGVALGVDDRATWGAVSALLAALYVNAISWSYLAAVLEKRGLGARQGNEATSVTMPPALVEGAETIVVYTAFLAVPAWSTWLFAAMAVLLGVNIVQRLRWARWALAPGR